MGIKIKDFILMQMFSPKEEEASVLKISVKTKLSTRPPTFRQTIFFFLEKSDRVGIFSLVNVRNMANCQMSCLMAVCVLETRSLWNNNNIFME